MKQPKKTHGPNPATASLIIRVGLALVFLYAGINAFIQPSAWISFIPEFSTRFIDPEISLDILSVFQIFLALWLLSGRYVKYSASLAISMLVGLMLFNLGTFLITFRDIGLIAAASALFYLDE